MLLMFPSFFPSKADILYSFHVYLVLHTSQRVNAHFYPTLKKCWFLVQDTSYLANNILQRNFTPLGFG